MTNFNYEKPGEFYSRKRQGMRPSGLTYRRFDNIAEAIRFAIEKLPSAALRGCMLESDGQRFGARELRELYASSGYPVQRNSQGARTATIPVRSAQEKRR